MSNKKKIIVILGQTAVGKSDMAVFLAKKFNGEVISADSRQVYKKLNIGTGKITKKEMCGVKHHLLDVCNPKKTFTINNFKENALEKINEIIKKNKIPIICGGTGFYIDSIVKNIYIPEVPPDKKLRKKLEKISTEKLFEMLEKTDSSRAKNIDKNNRVRIIRAIEIAKKLGKIPKIKKLKNDFEFLEIGLYLEKNVLRDKIKERLLKRIEKGMINEGRKIHKEGITYKRMFLLGLEYKYLALFLQRKISKEEMLKKLETEIWRYAKRQMTWFKRDKNIKWFRPEEKDKIEKEIKDFIKTI